MPIYPKAPIREKIPTRFVSILQHVARLIEIGDESTTIESDDMLQDDEHDYYGGLVDSEKQLFCFAYFVGSDEDDNSKWEFMLSTTQIHDIASGRLTELDMWQCRGGNCVNRYFSADSYCHECDSS